MMSGLCFVDEVRVLTLLGLGVLAQGDDRFPFELGEALMVRARNSLSDDDFHDRGVIGGYGARDRESLGAS